MASDKTVVIDTANIPPGTSVNNYIKQMMTTGLAPIYNPPRDACFEEVRFNSAERAMYALSKISILQGMKKLTDQEIARLISMIDSNDEENWTVAEECINQKFSEI